MVPYPKQAQLYAHPGHGAASAQTRKLKKLSYVRATLRHGGGGAPIMRVFNLSHLAKSLVKLTTLVTQLSGPPKKKTAGELDAW